MVACLRCPWGSGRRPQPGRGGPPLPDRLQDPAPVTQGHTQAREVLIAQLADGVEDIDVVELERLGVAAEVEVL